ncbi:restriction system modified-DNA reader domain-containing protein [Streptomyces bacillaris]
MPTVSLHFDPSVFAHLARATGDDTVHLTLSLGGGDGPPEITPSPVVPRGPLASLLQAGLLNPGTELNFFQRRANRRGRAVVTAEGQLIVDGHASPFPSPSKAAEAITGNVINGWTLWHLPAPDGRTLDDLRRELRRNDPQH